MNLRPLLLPALAGSLLLFCSQAPLIEREANRVVLVELLPVYRDMVDATRARKTMLELPIHSTGIDPSRLPLQLSLTPTDPSVDTITTLRLVAIIFEDSVPYYSFLMGTTFYSPMTVRAIIGDSMGIPFNCRLGMEFDTLLTTPVTGLNINRTGIAVSVQNLEPKLSFRQRLNGG